MTLQGLILIDKPIGLTSNRVVQKIKRLLQVKKVGHTGTLDPFATGMLPVLLGPTTKLATFYLAEKKTYRTRITLGTQTDTGDCEGKVIEEAAVPALDRSIIENVFAILSGPREQLPPLYSAIKYQGKPLYQWAREGIDVPRKTRPICIMRLTLLQYDAQHIEFEVECSKGTYIRTLAEEIAEQLGTVAYCQCLRRLSLGPFQETQMCTLEETEEKFQQGNFDFLLPAELGIQHFPEFQMSEEILRRVRQGLSLDASIEVPSEFFKLKSGQILLGVGKIDHRRIVKGRWLS